MLLLGCIDDETAVGLLVQAQVPAESTNYADSIRRAHGVQMDQDCVSEDRRLHRRRRLVVRLCDGDARALDILPVNPVVRLATVQRLHACFLFRLTPQVCLCTHEDSKSAATRVARLVERTS